MSDNAYMCPCKECENKKKDKMPVDSVCYQCDKRIIYDLSLTDSRLIPEYILEDITRISELREVELDDDIPKKANTPTWQINKKINKAAVENGWDGGYLSWIRYLNEEKKMTAKEIAKLCGLKTDDPIRRRLNKKYKGINDNKYGQNFKEVTETRFCQMCGKELVRIRYAPSKRKILGPLEGYARFLKRKFCDRKCSALFFADDKRKK